MALSGTSPSALSVIVGVSGGIAVYKAVSLVRELIARGCDVTVIPTHSALEFVGLPTWEAVSRNAVPTSLFEGVAEVRHVALGQQADLVIVAPATAHTISSMAAGSAGDLLGTTLLATTAPVAIAPAMHTEMWLHPSVQDNVELLRRRGVHVIGPESGPLTGGDVGVGRMSEPGAIADQALALVRSKDLAGQKVLISAGGTREPLDPVRFIGNRSTGYMGVALARAAMQRGADVTLVAAHLEVPVPSGIRIVETPTAAAMRDAMLGLQPEASLVIMAAAVADWVPEVSSPEKITKESLGESWSPVLRKSPDILHELCTRKPPGQQVVGFAAETDDDPAQRENRAIEKLRAKGADALVVNRVGDGVGFGAVETAVTLFFSAGPQSLSVEGTKDSIAERLLEALLDR